MCKNIGCANLVQARTRPGFCANLCKASEPPFPCRRPSNPKCTLAVLNLGGQTREAVVSASTLGTGSWTLRGCGARWLAVARRLERGGGIVPGGGLGGSKRLKSNPGRSAGLAGLILAGSLVHCGHEPAFMDEGMEPVAIHGRLWIFTLALFHPCNWILPPASSHFR